MVDENKKHFVSSSGHRKHILRSVICGCYYCLETFPSDKIVEWVDEDDSEEGQTAICPFCGIDAVIAFSGAFPDVAGYLARQRKISFSDRGHKKRRQGELH